jgi:hypothetical protein
MKNGENEAEFLMLPAVYDADILLPRRVITWKKTVYPFP